MQLNVGDECYEDAELWELVNETKKLGSKYVRDDRHADAIQRYSEVIMQCRKFSEFEKVKKLQRGEQLEEKGVTDDKIVEENKKESSKDDKGRHIPCHREIREMVSSCYLNLSLCFIKTAQWQHAYNTAHRAKVGDEEPPNPSHDVLTDAQKAKSLYRKCQAGDNLDSVSKESLITDLKKAIEFSPNDSDVKKMLQRIEKEVKNAQKKADKKLGGFLKKGRIGNEADDNTTTASSPDKTGVEKSAMDKTLDACEKKLAPGVYEAGKNMTGMEGKENNDEEAVEFFDHVCDDLADLMVNDPEKFAAIKEKIRVQCEEKGVLPEQVLQTGMGDIDAFIDKNREANGLEKLSV